MNEVCTADTIWAIEQLGCHVSYSGWFFAIMSGLTMWAVMFSLAI